MPNKDDEMTKDFDSYMEVVITDSDGLEYFYWVNTQDEDIAIEVALERHDELGRPEAVDDFEGGIFPAAYSPVIPWNKDHAVIINLPES